jgi:hypothetical protein
MGKSPAWISHLLKQILSMGFVTKLKKPKSHENLYVMEDLPYVNLQYFNDLILRFKEIYQQLIDIELKFASFPESFKNSEEFSLLYRVAKGIITMIAPINDMYEILRETMDEIKT